MRYLIAVIDSRTNTADSDEMAAIDEFNEQLRANDHWIMAAGLVEPSRSVTIDNRGSQPDVKLGPLHDTVEYMSGFWIIDVPDHETAVRLATAGSKACNRKVEVRPFIER